jgi:hypothetical protein
MIKLRQAYSECSTRILEDTNIDWNGFWAKYSPHDTSKKSVQVVVESLSDTEIASVKRDYQQLCRWLEPATSKDIANFLLKLKAHYWLPNMPDVLEDELNKDYKLILSQYPIAILKEVFYELILDVKVKHQPKLAEINERAEKLLKNYSVQKKYLKEIVDCEAN